MHLPILKALSADEFRSGEELARRFGISRASLHNLVAEARVRGVDVHAVRGKGYRLAAPCSWLDMEHMEAARSLGFSVELRDEVESTNSLLLASVPFGQRHKTVVVAEWQTGGRGRRGRGWLAPLGRGLTFSLLWRFERPLTALSGLSLAVGVALARALRALDLPEVGLKWPNDIWAGGGKLAGILIETQGDMLSGAAAVIGIGINVAPLEESLPDAAYRPVSVEELRSSSIDRNVLLCRVLAELDGVLNDFDRLGFSVVRAEWESLHVWQGCPVRVLEPAGGAFEGVALGVDEAGVLLISTGQGVRSVHAGEVSLRPGGGA